MRNYRLQFGTVLAACVFMLSNRVHGGEWDIPTELTAEQKAQLPGVYQRMLERGEVPKVGACIIFIPLPCPDEETFQKSLTFMLTACRVAQKGDAHIIIVRYGYGKTRPTSETWSGWLRQIEDQCEQYVSSGTVRMIDKFSQDVLIATPWGYLFRDGKPIDDDNITTWAKHPQPILRELERK